MREMQPELPEWYCGRFAPATGQMSFACFVWRGGITPRVCRSRSVRVLTCSGIIAVCWPSLEGRRRKLAPREPAPHVSREGVRSSAKESLTAKSANGSTKVSRNRFCAAAFGRGAALVLCLFAAPSFADTVTDWNETAVATIAAEKTNPRLASRNMALVQAAVFEAVNSITGSYTPYERQPAPRGASPEAAAMTAAYRVLLALYPDHHTELDTAYAQALQKVSSGTSKSDGITVGETAAAALLQRRSTDGAETITVYDAPSDPGVWEPSAGATPLEPGWGKVAPRLRNRQNFSGRGSSLKGSDRSGTDLRDARRRFASGFTNRPVYGCFWDNAQEKISTVRNRSW
jgi:hypothetical protein